MSGADDLRGLLSVAMYEKLYDALERESQVALVDAAFGVIEAAAADPVYRLAILDAMGLDVLEARNDGTDVAANGSGDTLAYFVAVLPFGAPIPDKALVVRPRGEATDA